MDLVPVRDQSSLPAESVAASPATENSVFTVSPERQQLIGVQFTEVTGQPLTKTIRTVGRVELDERRVAQIHSKISGWVEETFVDFTWQHVNQGDPLFTIYSPELVSAQEEYLLALRAGEQLGRDSNPFPRAAESARSLVGNSRERLRLWDVTPEQIADLEQTRTAQRTLTVYSPISGHVVERKAFPQMRITPDTMLYTIADHSVVWVHVDVYENEISFVRLGQKAPMTVPAYPGEVFHGTVTYIWPHVETQTRTLKVRLEFPNSDLRLKPGMYAQVDMEIPMGSRLVVPKSAVLRTGEQDIVFVDRGAGRMEVRGVRLGVDVDGAYEVLSGLRRGERVVTAANFLIDAESQVQGAVRTWEGPQGNGPQAPSPTPVGESQPGLTVEILEPQQATVGRNTIRLAAKDASGRPVENADVEVSLFMPQMGTMAPMTAAARLQPQGQGVYAGTVDIPMAFSWQTTVTVRREGRVIGSVRTTIRAQ